MRHLPWSAGLAREAAWNAMPVAVHLVQLVSPCMHALPSASRIQAKFRCKLVYAQTSFIRPAEPILYAPAQFQPQPCILFSKRHWQRDRPQMQLRSLCSKHRLFSSGAVQIGSRGIRSLQHSKAPLTMSEILEVGSFPALTACREEPSTAQRCVLAVFIASLESLL